MTSAMTSIGRTIPVEALPPYMPAMSGTASIPAPLTPPFAMPIRAALKKISIHWEPVTEESD